ncbi:MAG TPA: glycosyltransferase family 2 protein, partial [Gemmatales bacterium]|nr:glycosyltransferase family 2 protein [Gemmatales bacterium]
AEDRTFALGEWARVASKGLFFSCPDGKRVRKLEARADADFQARHGHPHPWLVEHRQYGWPTRREVMNLCETVGITCHRFINSPLAEWLPLLIATEHIFELGDTDLCKRFNEMLNLRPFRAFIQEPGYRTLYACFKSEASFQEASKVWQKRDTLSQAMETHLDPTRILARQLSEYVRDERRKEVHQARLLQLERQLQETQLNLAQTEKALLWERWYYQLASPKNKTKYNSGRKVISADIQHQLESFGPSHWRVAGPEATLIWSTSLNRGWHRVDIVAEVKKGYSLQFTSGTRDALNDDTRMTLINWQNQPERRLFYFYVHDAVTRLRLQLTQNDGTFVLHRMAIRPVAAWKVAAAGAIKLLSHGYKAPLQTWKRSRGYPSLLHYGMDLTTPHEKHATEDLHLTPYQRWLCRQRPGITERQQVVRTLTFTHLRIAFLLEIEDMEDMKRITSTLDSLLQQDSCSWQLCIAVKQELLEVCQALPACGHERIRWLIQPPDMGLASLIRQSIDPAEYDWLMILKAGDTLEANAACTILEASWKNRDAALIVSDEDTLLPHVGPGKPELKPVLEPETLLHQPHLLGDGVAVHVPTLARLGGFNPTYHGALLQEYVHRLFQSQQQIVHLKRVLLHKTPRPSTTESVRLVYERLAENYSHYSVYSDRLQISQENHPAHVSQRYVKDLVSILIPSAGRVVEKNGKGLLHLERCLDSLRRLPAGAPYEIVVVDQDNLSIKACSVIQKYDAKRISVPGPFHFSRSINAAAQVARGEYLLLLNDDTEVITLCWLERLLGLMNPGVGAVGARLLFSSGKIQHLGISLRHGQPIHPLYGQYDPLTERRPGKCWAVTAACLLAPHAVFDDLDGFDDSFELNYNDVDYCLRLRQQGYRIVLQPEVELYHHEAERLDGRAPYRPEELTRFQERWLNLYLEDPYWRSAPWGESS